MTQRLPYTLTVSSCTPVIRALWAKHVNDLDEAIVALEVTNLFYGVVTLVFGYIHGSAVSLYEYV
jgi:hypothetical protein